MREEILLLDAHDGAYMAPGPEALPPLYGVECTVLPYQARKWM